MVCTYSVHFVFCIWTYFIQNAFAQYTAPQSGKRQVHSLLVADKNKDKKTHSKNQRLAEVQALKMPNL
jgi:hypothetical protein